jgi:hydroxymethylbilane synthase
LGGGCQVPVGAYACSDGEMLLLTVFMGTLDGKKAFRAKLEGLTNDPRQLASEAYLALVEQGGGELIEASSAEDK